MSDDRLLMERLRDAGFAATSVRRTAGGAIAIAGVATLEDGGTVFAKTLRARDPEAFQPWIFEVEAEGLAALRDVGGVCTPQVLLACAQLLVLTEQQPRPDGPEFWEQLGRMVAGLHTSTVSDRFD